MIGVSMGTVIDAANDDVECSFMWTLRCCRMRCIWPNGFCNKWACILDKPIPLIILHLIFHFNSPIMLIYKLVGNIKKKNQWKITKAQSEQSTNRSIWRLTIAILSIGSALLRFVYSTPDLYYALNSSMKRGQWPKYIFSILSFFTFLFFFLSIFFLYFALRFISNIFFFIFLLLSFYFSDFLPFDAKNHR